MTTDPPRQAANYRSRLRDTEAERDVLAARIDVLQRRYIDTVLARENITADALFTVTDVAGLLDGDGLPDPNKIKAAAEVARRELGITPGLFVPAEGRLPTTTPRKRFTDAFTPKEK